MNKFLSITALAGALCIAGPALAHEPHVGIHIGVPNVIFSVYSSPPYHYYHYHHAKPAHHYHDRHPYHGHHHGATKHQGHRHWEGQRGHGRHDGYRHGR